MEPRIQAEYTVVEDGKTLSEMLVSGYKSKLKLNIFEIREDLWSIKLQDCGDVDNYTSGIDQKVKDYNLWAGPLTTDTISKMYFSRWEPPGVSERMWSVKLDASISGEYQTLGGHSCRPSE
jgi:hypothetical protein